MTKQELYQKQDWSSIVRYISRNYLLRVQPLHGKSFLVGATKFILLSGGIYHAEDYLRIVELRFYHSRSNCVSVRVGNFYINFIAR